MSRQSPLPASPEARQQGCTCPAPQREPARGDAVAIDDACPLHGLAAVSDDRAAEQGPIDTDGDIVDSASEPELRQEP